MKRKIITVANQKGGVGKTTTAVNIAAGLTAKGNKVLCIDLDPQGNLSEYLGFDGNGETISDLLLKVCTNTPFNATLAIRESIEGIWYIPANITLSTADIYMSTAFCREQLLCKVVLSECLEVFDYIIIDCLPSLGILLTNALATADSVLIPVQTQKFALDGLQALFDIISLVKNSLNPKLEVLGIVATMVDNTNMTKNALELLKGSGALLQSKISRSVSATNSTSEQKSLVKIGGKLGQEYVTLTEEIIKSFEVK